MLLLPHPLNANRLAGRLRQQGGVRGRVVVAVTAVASGAVQVNNAHFAWWKPENFGEVVAHVVRGLRRRPDGRAVRPDVRQRAGGSQRSVALIRPIVSCREFPGGSGHRRRRIPARDHRLILVDGGGAHVALQSIVRGEALPIAPDDFQFAGGAHGGPLVLGDDTHEVFYPHHADVGDRADGGFIHT